MSEASSESSAAIEVTQTNFNDIIERSAIVFIDFWADWCGPCKSFAPIFAAAANANPDITFGTVDVKHETQLATDFNARSIPLLVVLRDRVVIYAEAGAMTAAGLDELIERARHVDMQAIHAKIKQHESDQK